MTDELTAAYQQIPGYAELAAAVAKARGWRPALVTPLAAQRAEVERVVAALESGEDVPADVGRPVADALTAAANGGKAAEVMAGVREMLGQRLEYLVAANADRALKHLAGRIGTVLDQVAEAAPHLTGVRTADDAVRAGGKAAEAFGTVRRLLDSYSAIRSAQRKVTKAGWPSEGPQATSVLRVAGEFRDLDVLWSCWPRAVTTSMYLDSTTNTVVPVPWPSDADPLNHGYSTDYLIWAATDCRDHVWLPTTAELTAAYGQAWQAVNVRERKAMQKAGIATTAREQYDQIGA